MPKLIKLVDNTPTLIDNIWTVVDTDAEALPALSAGTPTLAPLKLWQASEAALNSHDRIGIALENTDDPEALADVIAKAELITIPFPAFTDGRGYSIARVIRDRLQFKGEIRAVGDVLLDQLFFMYRCGFDTYQLQEGVNAEKALKAFQTFTVKYQAASDEPMPLFAKLQQSKG